MYQFVLEVRDASGTSVLARGNAMYAHVDDIVTVPGDITTDTVWTNNNAYYLDKAPVYIGGDPDGTTVPMRAILPRAGAIVLAVRRHAPWLASRGLRQMEGRPRPRGGGGAR